MVEAIADRIRLSYVEENSYGAFPDPAEALTDLRITSESLAQETDTSPSEELRSDRQRADVTRTQVRVSGDIAFELSYASFDAFLEAVLQADSTWSSEVTDVAADTGIAAVASGNQLTGADEEFANYNVGEWVKIAGFSTSGNNGLAKISAINSSNPGTADNDELVLTGITLTDEAAGNAVSVTQLSSITNGTTQKSYCFEKNYTDLTNEFMQFLGCVIDQMSLEVAAESKITGSMNIIGKISQSASSTGGDGSYNAVNTNEVMTAVEDVLAILENQADQDCLQFNLTIGNNSRARPLIGQLGAKSIGAGKLDVSGSLQVYFENSTLMDKYLGFTSSSLAVTFQDTAGNNYVIDLPEIKYTDGKPLAGGESSDIIAEMTWMAIRDTAEDITIRIARDAA